MSATRQVEWIALRDAKMLRWMADNQEAVDAVNTITGICDVWDDLIDGDRVVTAAAINTAFTKALVGLHQNAFYKRHEAQFFGLMVIGINAWLDANELQNSALEKWRMLAFYLRTFGFEIAHLAAMLAGGFDHMRRVSMEMRTFFENETYAEWEHRMGASHGLER
jgi:hypothetical protein